jgi:2-keto-4-pentenoate hydratase/2-oxohepta-3-ene-1,7-dioic acid hydratase in catechol pathway
MDIKINDKNFTAQRVFCIGRNYVAHAHELGNDVPDEPIIFAKPATALTPHTIKTIPYPAFGKNLHYETELVVLIGKEGIPSDEQDALNYVAGLAVGFDLTMRDVQDKLRAEGLSWEISKGFDFSAPIGEFSPFDKNTMDLTKLNFTGSINGEVKQDGDTSLMIFPITRLLVELGRFWKLLPGDLLYTGTPAGVGPLNHGDEITATDHLGNSYSWDIG